MRLQYRFSQKLSVIRNCFALCTLHMYLLCTYLFCILVIDFFHYVNNHQNQAIKRYRTGSLYNGVGNDIMIIFCNDHTDNFLQTCKRCRKALLVPIKRVSIFNFTFRVIIQLGFIRQQKNSSIFLISQSQNISRFQPKRVILKFDETFYSKFKHIHSHSAINLLLLVIRFVQTRQEKGLKILCF